MTKNMNLLGIGGKLIVYTGGYILFATVLTFFFPNIFISRFAPFLGLLPLVYIWLPLGLILLAVSAWQVATKFKASELMTDGFFRYSRNPLYAAWAFFILPSLVILSSSWLFIGTPVVFYIVFKIFIVEEEKYLEDVFGEEYLAYRKKTGQLLPMIF